ncbi:MAG: cupin domain-containing protein [Wujia sp.]
MNYSGYTEKVDYGGMPYVANIEKRAVQNTNFRTTIWTGCNLQMTLMCIPPCGEIGLEIHKDTDQFIRVEQGMAVVVMGKRRSCLDFEQKMCKGDAAFIPAETWHNVVNLGRTPLKLSVFYAPPNHQKGTVHRTKADAEKEEY